MSDKKEIGMRVFAVVALVHVLLILAAIPWIASLSQPLLPEEFRQERERYTVTVSAAQEATIEAMREASSSFEVLVIGTVEPTRDAFPTSRTSTPVPSYRATPASSPTSELGSTTPTPVMESYLPVSASVGTPTITPRQIVVRSQKASIVPTTTPTVLSTQTTTAMPLLALPSRSIDVKDIITEGMLAEQIERDINQSSLSGLTVRLSPNGISAIAFVTVIPGFEQRIKARGVLAIENYNLVVRISSIRSNGVNVTERYRGQLESIVNSSLYRLLPQRYVQSYELADGEIRVFSKMKSEY